MNAKSKFLQLLAILLIFTLTSCAQPQPTAAPQAAPATQSAEEPKAVSEEAKTTQESEAASGPKRGGTLVIGHSVEVHGLDPHINPAFDNLRFYELVYNQLVHLTPELEVVPELAESWDISEDGKTYTFHLRQGVYFHDGNEMTSEDVKASYERILNPDTKSVARGFFTSISTIDAQDKYTVVFNLSQPNAAILALTASSNAAILSKDFIEKHDPDKEVMGTGAFKLEEWVPDNYMRLVRHDKFFIEGQPYVDAIDYRLLPDEASILAGLRAKTIDFGMMLDVQNALLAQKDNNLVVMGGPGLNTQALAFNVEREPLNNPLVRLAIACAIDREQISNITFMGEAIPTAPLPPTIPEIYQIPFSELECYTRDVERSKSLLTEAGFPDGVSFKILTRTFAPFPDMAQVVQSQLKEAGIETEIELEEFGIFVSRWKEHDFDAFLSTTSQFPDPAFALYRTFHTEGSTNVQGYSNPEMDKLLEQGQAVQDPAERAKIYAEIQKLISKEAAHIFLVTENQYRVMQPYVKGFQHIPTQSLLYLREVWLDK